VALSSRTPHSLAAVPEHPYYPVALRRILLTISITPTRRPPIPAHARGRGAPLRIHGYTIMSTLAPPAPAEKPRTDIARIDSRVRGTVGNRNGPGAVGSFLTVFLVIASAWYLWHGVRGYWTHTQEGAVSAIQIAIGVFALVLAFAQIVYSGWAFWAVAAVLLGIAGYALNAMLHDAHAVTRAWAAIGASLLFLYDHLSNRARFGHRTAIRPFEPAPPVEPGITELLTGAARRENLVIALNNAIAEAGRIRDLPEDALTTVAAAGGSSLERELKDDAAWLYRGYVAHFTAGGVVSPDAPGEMEHLAVLLRLPEETVKRAHRDIGGELYKARMEEAARDRVLAPDEAESLAQIHSQLDLADEDVEKIRVSAQGDVLRKVYFEVEHGGRTRTARPGCATRCGRWTPRSSIPGSRATSTPPASATSSPTTRWTRPTRRRSPISSPPSAYPTRTPPPSASCTRTTW
jgi:hypothetical protein